MHSAKISIWFFIGTLLLIYGVLILGWALYELSNPPAHPVVLAETHSGIWWGILMLLGGALYMWLYSPTRTRK